MSNISLLSRALGPASGNLGDAYPFLAPGVFTGYLAGLSFSGIPETTKYVHLLELSIQEAYASLKFDVDGKEYTVLLTHWTRKLSRHHRLHFWGAGSSILVTAVTFEDTSDADPQVIPPYTVTGRELVDPFCYLPFRKPTRLFKGATVLSPGENISLKAERVVDTETDIITDELTAPSLLRSSSVNVTISRDKDVVGGQLRSIQGVRPDCRGNVTLRGDGSYLITREIEEIDSEGDFVRLKPSIVSVDNTNSTCCDCEEFKKKYYEISDLSAVAADLTLGYNQAYEKLQASREIVYTKLKEAAKLVQLRLQAYAQVSGSEDKWQYIYSLICSNVFETDYTQRSYRFSLEGSPSAVIQHIQIFSVPPTLKCSAINFIDLAPDGRSFIVLPITSPPLSNKGIVLEMIVSNTEFETLKWTSEPLD